MKEPTISKKYMKGLSSNEMCEEWQDRIDWIFKGHEDEKNVVDIIQRIKGEYSDKLCKEVNDWLKGQGVTIMGIHGYKPTGKSLPEKIEITDEMCEEGSVWINDERGKEEYTLYYSIGGDMWYFENKEWGWSSVQFDTAEGICRYQIEDGYTFLRPADKLPKAAFKDFSVWAADGYTSDKFNVPHTLVFISGEPFMVHKEGHEPVKREKNRFISKTGRIVFTYREDLKPKIVKKENNNDDDCNW